MKLKNDVDNKYFYSKLGRKIGKQNLLLYRWTHKKKKNRPSSVSPALAKIKYLYKINQLKNEKRFDDSDNDIFSIEIKERQKLENISRDIEENKENIKEKKTKNDLSRHKGPNYFFNKKIDNKNKLQPSCTKYNPKYDIIFKRSVSTPSFKSMLGRKDFIKTDDSKFYLKQKLIKDTMAGKSFIDFSKQIKRNSIFDQIEEKAREDISNIMKRKSVILSHKEDFNDKKNKSTLTLSKNDSKNNKNISQSKSTINHYNNSDIISTNNSNDSYDLFKHIYISKIKKKKHKRKYDTTNEIKKIKSVDFNQMISREDLEKIQSKQISIVPYLFPNYSLVRDRPIMMVFYENKERKHNKSRDDLNINMYNLSKYNNSINANFMHTPNFRLMKSKPDDDDPYPSYMRGVYDKNNCFKVSSESLKSVNYSNSKFIMPLSSIWKNNSFNKYTNLKMIKWQKNLMNAFLKNDKLDIDIKTKKLMHFYKKNYTDFIGGKSKGKYNNLENNIFRGTKSIQDDKNIKDLIKDLKE